MLDLGLQSISLCFPNAAYFLLLNSSSEEIQMSYRIGHQKQGGKLCKGELGLKLDSNTGFVSVFLLRLNAYLAMDLYNAILLLLPNFAYNSRSLCCNSSTSSHLQCIYYHCPL